MKIEIKYTETLKQVLGIIIIPLLYAAVYIFIILNMPKYELSEMMETIIIFGGIFLMMVLIVLTIFKFIMVDGEIEYDIRGIHFHLKRKSFLYPHDDFFISYTNIESASLNTDSAGRTFATIKIKSPDKSLLITANNKANTDLFVEYWDGLENQFSNFNATNEEHPAMLIKKKGFYESSFIKFLAYFSASLTVLFTVIRIINPDSVSIWKLVAFYCYAIPFIYTVFKSNKKPD